MDNQSRAYNEAHIMHDAATTLDAVPSVSTEKCNVNIIVESLRLIYRKGNPLGLGPSIQSHPRTPLGYLDEGWVRYSH